jgi:hypothetical protein
MVRKIQRYHRDCSVRIGFKKSNVSAFLIDKPAELGKLGPAIE